MKALTFSLATLALVAALAPAVWADQTDLLENLGRPEALDRKGEYASNVWDLMMFEGELYIGAGNSSNMQPNANAGPIPILKLDPATDTFSSPFTVDEEQIEIYRVLDGQLVIPGHDPTGNPKKGNFYRLEQGTWFKYATVPNGIHTYDMASYKGELYGALGARNDVVRSSDGGQSWSRVPMGVVPSYGDRPPYARSYVLFEFEGKLWSVGRLSTSAGQKYDRAGQGLWSWDGTTAEEREDLSYKQMMPGIADFSILSLYKARPHRPLVFGGALYYLGAEAFNDHQVYPSALYKASTLQRGAHDIELVRPTDASEPLWHQWRPWDLVARDGSLYMLASKAQFSPDSETPHRL